MCKGTLCRLPSSTVVAPRFAISPAGLVFDLVGSGRGRSERQFQLFSVNRMVWAGAAALLIILILAPAVFRSMSAFDERSRQLAALEKELVARSVQLAAR